MITFKTLVRKDRQRPDKTWCVYIRVTHNRASRYINTGMVVEKKELTTSFKIKNQQILDKCEDIIRRYRQRAVELNLAMSDKPLEDIIALLQAVDDAGRISFTAFFKDWMTKSNLRNLSNHKAALRRLQTFFGRDEILFSEINTRNMMRFLESLDSQIRTPSLYIPIIKRVFNQGRLYYNDEDNDIMPIKHNLDRLKSPKQNATEKRALTLAQIRKIFELPHYTLPHTKRGRMSTHDVALDCFRLSFCLMGTNAADLYHATMFDGTTLCYERQKTRTSRADKAKIEIVVPDMIKPLFAKYKGKNTVFNFCETYSSRAVFNNTIGRGMKIIAKELGLNDLTFYAARHSMATIALNEVGIDKWTVHELLNHIDPSTAVTDIYIKRDFHRINAANAKLMAYVFGGAEEKQ